MEEIGIISSSNGESFNKELLKFSEKYQIKKEKNAKRVADFRARQENVTHYVSVSNAPKVKLSKVKLNKGININGAFAPPTEEEAIIYFTNNLKATKDQAVKFYQFYGSKNWMVGKKTKA